MQYCSACCSVVPCRAILQCVAVCCSVSQCVAVCCSVVPCRAILQCVAVCCSVSQCVAVCCSVLPCRAILQCVVIAILCSNYTAGAALYCGLLQLLHSVLRCTVVCCSIHTMHLDDLLEYTASHCNTLQQNATQYNSGRGAVLNKTRSNATHSNTLHHIPKHCSTLQQ